MGAKILPIPYINLAIKLQPTRKMITVAIRTPSPLLTANLLNSHCPDWGLVSCNYKMKESE